MSNKLHPIFEQIMAPYTKNIPPRENVVDYPYKGRAYGEWCRDPAACKGKGYCPLDPTCAD